LASSGQGIGIPARGDNNTAQSTTTTAWVEDDTFAFASECVGEEEKDNVDPLLLAVAVDGADLVSDLASTSAVGAPVSLSFDKGTPSPSAYLEDTAPPSR
jgi:hypothetical protein